MLQHDITCLVDTLEGLPFPEGKLGSERGRRRDCGKWTWGGEERGETAAEVLKTSFSYLQVSDIA